MPTFAEQIAAFKRKTEAKMAAVVQATVWDIGDRLVEGSPVGQWDKWSDKGKALNPKPPYEPGEFKGSWQYSFGVASTSHPATIDASGRTSMNEFREVKASNMAGMHTLYNNAPYGRVLEYGSHPLIGAWHLHDPNKAHVTELAAQAFQTIVNRNARKVVDK